MMDVEEQDRITSRGCDGFEPSHFFLSDAPDLRRCPWSDMGNEPWILLEQYQDWKNLDALPFGGSDIMDQPAWVFEAFKLIDAEIRSVDQEKQKEAAQDQENALKVRGPNGSHR